MLARLFGNADKQSAKPVAFLAEDEGHGASTDRSRRRRKRWRMSYVRSTGRTPPGPEFCAEPLKRKQFRNSL
jgi:hypothetical protein